jgi:nitrogen-specific signal transduction histidine kinase
MEIGFRPVKWGTWPIHNGKVVAIKGRDTYTGNDVISFPTVVVTGKDLPLFSIPIPVAGSFQSTDRLSLIEVEQADISMLAIRPGARRAFVLALPNNLIDAAARARCLQQGLAMIAAQNQDALKTLIKSSLHALNNYMTGALGLLSILEAESPAQHKVFFALVSARLKDCRDLIERANQEVSSNQLDETINLTKSALDQTSHWFAMIQAHFDSSSGPIDKSLQEAVITVTRNLETAMGMIARTISSLDDLGQLSILEAIELERVKKIQKLLSDLLPERTDLLKYKIWGNRILLDEIVEELVANAQRATGRNDYAGVRLEVDVLTERGEIIMTLINTVYNHEMRVLAEQGNQLFAPAIDPFDGFEKQRIFHQGVSSRPVGGGTGLAVVWARVVLNLQGKIEADYYPEDNEFILSICLKLA